MQNMIWTGVVAGSLAAAASALAFGLPDMWESAPGSRSSGSKMLSSAARLMEYDADKDGRVTRFEIDAGLVSEFRSVDSNSDGRLDAAEIQRHVDTRRAQRRARDEAWRAKAAAQGLDPKRPPFDRSERDNVDTLRYADWNLDGAVTPDEFGGRTRAQFMKADRDADGNLSSDELKKGGGTRGPGSPPRSASLLPAEAHATLNSLA